MSGEGTELTKLKMVDIWGLKLKEYSLVNVLACSGGAANTLSESDESLIIGTVLLVSGASNVICCAWPVKKIVAAVVIRRLYKNMFSGSNNSNSTSSSDVENGMWKVGEHLGEVRRWLRGLTDLESLDVWEEHDPEDKLRCGIGSNEDFYHWGAFMLLAPPD